MKNYEAMSDEELNFEVARHSYDAGWLERHYGKEGMVPDYCNDWADAGPIIAENKISIISTKASEITWFAGRFCHYPKNQYDPWFDDKNPLRAAMIVFLMMRDADK